MALRCEPMRNRPTPRLLSIAGSDSGGGAGIQADLKAFAACGVHGMTAITAVTAQNTVGVRAIHHVPPDVIKAQVAAIIDDIGVDAIKIGMLGTVATIDAVWSALEHVPREVPVVLDPVMVAESGAILLEPEARLALVERLLPRATVVTPNLPEAREIVATGAALEPRLRAGGAVAGDRGGRGDGHAATGGLHAADGADWLLLAIRRLGPPIVIVTGGHRELATDLFFDGTDVVEIPGDRHPDGAAHGSGCTHASVVAARLALGDDPLTAARAAKEATARAVADGLREIGAGAGPVDILGLSRASAR
jgi:hydroxymethylpyrimidine/phosphomethylpyrimidine kinase